MQKLNINTNGRFQPLSGVKAQLNLSRNTIDKLATECQAKIIIGKSVRYDMEKLNEHMEILAKRCSE